VASLLDVRPLAELFKTLHSETETFVREQSERLKEHEEASLQAQRSFREARVLVRSFLDEFVSEGQAEVEKEKERGSDDEEKEEKGSSDEEDDKGADAAKENGKKGKAKAKVGQKKAAAGDLSLHDKFTKKELPQFVKFVVDDQRAMQDADELLTHFVQRHLKSQKELQPLLNKSSQCHY